MTVTTADIAAATERLAGRVVRTPVLEIPGFVVKAENLQHTGSFKARGAQNALLARPRPAGVATFSAGNHAAATAYAGRSSGLPVVVCMPPGAVDAKVAAVHRYGGEIVFTEDLVGTCQALAAERGYDILHPFDDPDVIAGAATVGRELLDQAGPLDLVVVPVGGGGLISGVAAAVAPATRVIGVEPATANAMNHAFRHGPLVPLPRRPVSLADGLTAPYAGKHTLEHVNALVERVVEIPEEIIADAWWELMDLTKLLLEPSAAVGYAAVKHGLVDVPPDARVALILSGGNVSRSALR